MRQDARLNLRQDLETGRDAGRRLDRRELRRERGSAGLSQSERHPLAVPRWWHDAGSVLMWASLVVVVALWLSNRGIQNLTTVDSLNSVARLAGLLSADLLLVQVVLMARVPLLERAYGQDELTRLHRIIGFASFDLLLAHVVLIIFGYAAPTGVGFFAEAGDLIANFPGMLLATAATALFVLVVISSVRIARKGIRYESWHLLHLYAYIGVGLSIPHEVWTGADFTASPLSRIYWWTIYGISMGSVLVWRFWVPLRRTLKHTLIVDRVVRESDDVVSVYLRGRNLDQLNAAAGQFFTWRFFNGRGWTRGHPYSLSAAPTDDRLRITVKDLGDGSKSLAGLRSGTPVFVEGPYGRLHAGTRTQRCVTLLASGIGITPMRALMEELSHAPGQLTLVYRAPTSKNIVFRSEIDALAARTGARVFYVLGPRFRGRSSWLPNSASNVSDAQALRDLVPDIARHDVYICGADGWMDAARDAALGAGVAAEHIHLERFNW